MRQKEFSRKLRKNLTDAEKTLWRHLRHRQIRGVKFRRQVPIGKYIVDFLSFEPRMIIEVDGGQHYNSLSDRERDAWLRKQGFSVYRFWNNEVLSNIDGVKAVIFNACCSTNPPPS